VGSALALHARAVTPMAAKFNTPHRIGDRGHIR